MAGAPPLPSFFLLFSSPSPPLSLGGYLLLGSVETLEAML